MIDIIELPNCPACGSGLTYLDLDRDDDGELTPRAFTCQLCGLEWFDEEQAAHIMGLVAEERPR